MKLPADIKFLIWIVAAFDSTKEHLHLIFKRKDLQTGDELRIELEVLEGKDENQRENHEV